MFISYEKLSAYRKEKYKIITGQQLKNIEQAEIFVKDRGFVFFWPIKNIELPSLWTAVAGNRPVANAHDDPGHITWGWKDESLGRRTWYYGKILRKKGTMISFELAPYFYTLSRNFGNPDEDVLIDFYDGRLSKEARLVFELIAEKGPLDTIAIRRAAHMTSKESNYPFDKAITYLQSDFKIVPIGISDSGGWRYAYIYDLVHRHYPDLPKDAQEITDREARKIILDHYFESVGAAQFQIITSLFSWNNKETQKAIEDLISDGKVIDNLEYPKEYGRWLAVENVICENKLNSSSIQV